VDLPASNQFRTTRRVEDRYTPISDHGPLAAATLHPMFSTLPEWHGGLSGEHRTATSWTPDRSDKVGSLTYFEQNIGSTEASSL
jgi:hypothetical protein